MPAGPVLYRAAWVCPVVEPPIKNGCVLVVDGRITAVEPYQEAMELPRLCRTIDLGCVAIVPGLVNAHTHLEFSQLEQPLGQPGIKFTDWVRLVVGQRSDVDPSAKHQSIVAGIQESFQAGVWAVGDIATDPVGEESYLAAEHETPVHTTVFLEQLGRKAELLEQQRTQLDVHLLKNGLVPESFTCGASPHATYSVTWGLHDQICAAAKIHNSLVAMHVAETLAERQLCDSLTGDFVDLLQDFDAWDPKTFVPRRSIKGFLGRLSQAPRSLVVHGNYLDTDELDLVQRNKNMSIVFCPRTHQFFQHTPYPLQAMLDRGINVAVGTDSRASNPDLNLFADLQLIAADFPKLSAMEVLKLGTVNGALALGKQDELGTLAVGKQAAISYVSNEDYNSPRTVAKVDQWLFDSKSSCQPVTDGSIVANS